MLVTPFETGADTLLVWLMLLCFGGVVWLTYRLGVGALLALGRRRRRAGRADAAGARARRAAGLPGHGVRGPDPRRGAAGGAPAQARRARAGAARRRGPDAPRGVGARRALRALDVARAGQPRGGSRSRRSRALAPLLWAAHGLVRHRRPAALAARDRGPRARRRPPPQARAGAVLDAAVLRLTLREPLVVGFPIGLVFAWRHRRREALLPLAAVAAMLAVFMVGPVFGLPLIARYVRTPAVLLTLFYGLAVCGWMLLPPGRERRIWLVRGRSSRPRSRSRSSPGTRACSPTCAPTWSDAHAGLRRPARRRPRAGRAQRGGRRAARWSPPPTTAPIPHLRWWLDTPPFSVGTPEAGASPLRRVLLAPRDVRSMRRFYDENVPARGRRPPDYRPVYRNASWRVLAAPECREPR